MHTHALRTGLDAGHMPGGGPCGPNGGVWNRIRVLRRYYDGEHGHLAILWRRFLKRPLYRIHTSVLSLSAAIHKAKGC